MPTLLVRIEGPMQSWGIRSRYYERDTALEPTKSGIIGMVCAAMGRPRDADISDLAGLKMAVRVDREGKLSKDYHTVLDVPRADSSTPGTAVSNRYYLADARFLVALEGEMKLLESIKSALKNPIWPIFLGRKAFLPSQPLLLGDSILDCDAETALRSTVWLGREQEPRPEKLRLVLETTASNGEARLDVPVSFVVENRTYAQRFVRNEWLKSESLDKEA